MSTTTARKSKSNKSKKSTTPLSEETVRETPETVQETVPETVAESETVREEVRETKKGTISFNFKEFEEELDHLRQSAEDRKNSAKEELVSIKKLTKDFKRLQYELKHTKLRKPRNASDSTREASGFASLKGTYLSPELCEFLGIEKGTKLPRTNVTSRLRDYIKNNGREDPKDRRNIVLDSKLEKLLGNSEFRTNAIREHKLRNPKIKGPVTDKVHYFNLQIHLRRHFIEDVQENQTSVASAAS
jgi:chromatin remodeling complex protein RSC6